MSIIKYQPIPSQDVNGTPTVVRLGGGNFTKTAGYENLGSEMREYLATVKPKEGYAYLLIAAMGDQNWGTNRNGDYWPTKGLSNPTPEFGYKTYEENGHWYHHHQNKDPYPSYGNVIKSVWNDRMGRIELVVEVDLNKDDKTRMALELGETIQTSMGSKIKWDCCVVCHPNWEEFYKIPEEEMIIISKENDLAKIHEIGKKYSVDLTYITKLNPDGGPVGIHSNMSKYCDHMKKMRCQILPSGQQVCVANMRPRFFDISLVGVNADKSSFVLAKVAEEGKMPNSLPGEEYPNEDIPDTPEAEVPKLPDIKTADQIDSPGDSNIHKEIEGGEVIADDFKDIEKYYTDHICPEMYRKEPELPDKVVDEMAGKYSLPEILSSFLAMGMFPHPREFQRVVMIQMGKQDELKRVDDNGDYLRLSDINPVEMEHEPDEYPIGISPGAVNEDLMQMLKHFFWERSGYRRPLVKRMVIIKQAEGVNAYINPYSEAPKQRSFAPALLATLGGLYAISAMESKKRMTDVVSDVTKPEKNNWLGAKLGLSIAAAIMANKIISGAQREKYEEAKYDALHKHAFTMPPPKVDDKAAKAAKSVHGSVGVQAAKLVGPMLGTYMVAGHIINKAQSGREISKPEELIAKYPWAAGGLATLTVNKPMFIPRAIGSLFKRAEMGLDMSEINIDELPLEDRDLGGIAVWSMACRR